MNDRYGYLDREGRFYPYNPENILAHNQLCEDNGWHEDTLLDCWGWVKTSAVLSRRYIYLYRFPLTSAQVDWLVSHDFEIDSCDLGEE